MPPELHNDQELVLKKRARRRLVGAIALVLLMVIILPRILQDRAALAPQEAVKISMPEVNTVKLQEVTIPADASSDPIIAEAHPVDLLSSAEVVIPETATVSEVGKDAKVDNGQQVSIAKNSIESKKVELATVVSAPELKKVAQKVVEAKPAEVKLAESKTSESKATEPKATEPKVPETKVSETKSTEAKVKEPKVAEAKPQKHDGNFTIQVGVFSDLANVKQLQEKLKNAGLDSRRETINTEKGDKIRLKAGNFSSRQAALSALDKLKSANLSGMVVSND